MASQLWWKASPTRLIQTNDGKPAFTEYCPCDCDPNDITDGFDAEGPQWEHGATSDGWGLGPSSDWNVFVDAGELNMTIGFGAATSVTLARCAVRPALNGLITEASAVLSSAAINGAIVLCFPGEVKSAFHAPSGQNRLWIRNVAVAAVFTVTSQVVATGDRIGVRVTDTSSGGGTYKIEALHNGSVVHTLTSQSATIGDPFDHGITVEGIGTFQFDDYEFKRN